MMKGELSVVAALARVYPCIDNPTVAESLAAWQAVVFCCDLGIQLATFEGDSLIVASALNKEDHCCSAYGQMIEDTKVELNTLFS
jgi:hypothetical protein